MDHANADLFDLNPLPSWLCDYNTYEVMQVNQAAIRSFGYSKKQWAKLSFEEAFIPQSDNRKKFNGSYSLLTPDGGRVSVKLSADVIVYNAKDCWLVVSYPEASGRLPATEPEQTINRLSEAMRFSRMGLAELTFATQELYLSPELLELLDEKVNINMRLSLSEFITEYVVEDDRECLSNKISASIQDASKALTRFTTAFRVRTAKGTIKHIEASGTFLKTGIGVGIFQDITTRKQHEDELYKLALIARHTSNAVVFTDKAGVITWVNNGFERLTEYTLEESVGKRPSMLQGEETDMDIAAFMREAAMTGKGFRSEVLNYTRSGRKIWMDVEVMPTFSKAGEFNGFMAIQSDITTLKTAVHEMLRSEDLLHTFMDNAPVIVFLKDLQGRYNFNNKSFVDTFVKDKQAKNFYIGDDLLPALTHQFSQADAQILKTGESIAFEQTIQVNGQPETYFTIKFPLKDLHGITYALGGIALPLTERKKAEQSLMESELRYRSIVNDQNELICRYGRGGVLSFVNKAYEKKFNKRSDELVGKTFITLVQPEIHDTVAQYIEDVFTGAQMPTYNQYLTITGDGSARWMEWFDFPIVNEAGTIIEIQSIGHDITDRKKLEAEQARLDTIVRESYNEIYIFNAESLNFEFANASAIRNIGYSLPELLQIKFSDLFYYPDKMALRALLAPLRRKNIDRLHLQIKYRRKDGSHYDVDAVIQVIDGSLVAIANDITQKLATEKKLIASVLEKETLVKEIHHRVKNNLQLISSIIYIKLMALDKSDVRDFLENTRQKIHSIALIHERLLQSNTLDKIEISEYLGKLIYDLYSTHSRQDLVLEIIPDIHQHIIDLDTAIYCGMIVNELITNSMKHAFENRSHGKIEIHFYRDQDHYILSVEDDGVSISDDIVPDHASSFGMQLLHIFVKQLKGSLEIIREKGTKFQIRFITKQE